jgi:hypothetical protein
VMPLTAVPTANTRFAVPHQPPGMTVTFDILGDPLLDAGQGPETDGPP